MSVGHIMKLNGESYVEFLYALSDSTVCYNPIRSRAASMLQDDSLIQGGIVNAKAAHITCRGAASTTTSNCLAVESSRCRWRCSWRLLLVIFV